ncbi:hypothetical protein [Phytohabitans houttuyneae]|nr:hypothetical protein [Phytohabitans houttuyneae]
MADMDALAWPLAGITFCRTCQQPWQAHPAGRDRRFYLCPECLDLHPAQHIEHLIAAVTAERDWIRKQHTNHPGSAGPLRLEIERLVARIIVAATDPVIEVWWRPAAIVPAHSPWLGFWTGPWRPCLDRGPPVPHR